MSDPLSNLRFVFDGQPPPIPDDGVPIPDVPDHSPALSDLELVADIWAADARESRHAAERATSIAALARRRRIERDRDFGPLGGPGLDSRLRQHAVLSEVSETFVSELALIRGCSEIEAESLAVESVLLTTKLTGTWAELYAGRIDVRKMRAIVDLLGAGQGSAVEDRSSGRCCHAPSRLTVAAAASPRPPGAGPPRRTGAEGTPRRGRPQADVRHQPDRRRHEPADHRHAARGRPPRASTPSVSTPSYLRADGDRRPIGVIRAEVASDLILRPWDDSRPSVTAQLVVHAPLAALRPDGPAPSRRRGRRRDRHRRPVPRAARAARHARRPLRRRRRVRRDRRRRPGDRPARRRRHPAASCAALPAHGDAGGRGVGTT